MVEILQNHALNEHFVSPDLEGFGGFYKKLVFVPIRAKALLKSRPSKLWFLLESTQLQQGVEKPVLLAQKRPRYEKLSSLSKLFEKNWLTRSKQVFTPTGTLKNF